MVVIRGSFETLKTLKVGYYFHGRLLTVVILQFLLIFKLSNDHVIWSNSLNIQ